MVLLSLSSKIPIIKGHKNVSPPFLPQTSKTLFHKHTRLGWVSQLLLRPIANFSRVTDVPNITLAVGHSAKHHVYVLGSNPTIKCRMLIHKTPPFGMQNPLQYGGVINQQYN